MDKKNILLIAVFLAVFIGQLFSSFMLYKNIENQKYLEKTISMNTLDIKEYMSYLKEKHKEKESSEAVKNSVVNVDLDKLDVLKQKISPEFKNDIKTLSNINFLLIENDEERMLREQILFNYFEKNLSLPDKETLLDFEKTIKQFIEVKNFLTKVNTEKEEKNKKESEILSKEKNDEVKSINEKTFEILKQENMK